MKFVGFRVTKRFKLAILEITISFILGFIMACWMLMNTLSDQDRQAYCERSWLEYGLSKVINSYTDKLEPMENWNRSSITSSASSQVTHMEPDKFYWDMFNLIREVNKLPRSSVKQPRLLCWIMTDPGIQSKARHAQQTWLPKCDVPLIFSSKEDREFPTIGLKVAPGRRSIAAKSHLAWEHVHRHYRDKADYFLKGDPDSYVFVNNLKRFLANRSPSHPSLFGHALYIDLSNHSFFNRFKGFYAAGEGIVMSREALINFIKIIDFCPLVNGTAEDMKSCICLSMVGVKLTDTRDIQGRETFLPPINLYHVANSRLPPWYTLKYRRFIGYCSNLTCLSGYPIVTHYVKPTEMYIYEYMSRVIDELTEQVNNSGSNYHFRGLFKL